MVEKFAHGDDPGGLHVAIILDGNRRWGRRQNRGDSWGHYKGAQVLKRIVKKCPQVGVKYLTVFAFSTENWRRSSEEVDFLMNLMESYLKKERQPLHNHNVKVRFLGERHRLSQSLLRQMEETECLTQHNAGLQLDVALDYGGRREIIMGMKEALAEAQKNTLTPDAITEKFFERFLLTYPHPNPDILIRTGGDYRVSNYLLWQIAYTEFFFLPIQWPDFTFQHLKTVVESYHKRTRTYGGDAHV